MEGCLLWVVAGVKPHSVVSAFWLQPQANVCGSGLVVRLCSPVDWELAVLLNIASLAESWARVSIWFVYVASDSQLRHMCSSWTTPE